MAKAVDVSEFLQGEIGKLIEQSRDGVHRVKEIVEEIVENLRDFSRIDSAEWYFANLDSGLESTLDIVWNEMGNRVAVVKVFAGLPSIECIGLQLNQVLLNLLINAAQAIEGRGVIPLRTGFDDDTSGCPLKTQAKASSPIASIQRIGLAATGIGQQVTIGLELGGQNRGQYVA